MLLIILNVILTNNIFLFLFLTSICDFCFLFSFIVCIMIYIYITGTFQVDYSSNFGMELFMGLMTYLNVGIKELASVFKVGDYL